LARFFLREDLGIGAGTGAGVATAPSPTSPFVPLPSAGASPSTASVPAGRVPVVAVASGSSPVGCMSRSPAPYSTMLIAQSLHATRCRHGSSTTSRVDERQSIHSLLTSSTSFAFGATATADAGAGGYVIGANASGPSDAGRAEALECEDRP